MITGCIFLAFIQVKTASAQNIDYDFSLGFGASATQAYADVAKKNVQPAFSIGYYSHLNEFATLSLELQIGKLGGGDRNTDAYKREFLNNYGAVLFCGDVQAGTFFAVKDVPAKNTLRNIYAGSGIGVLFNSMKYVQRTNPITGDQYSGTDQSTNFLLPLRIGYELKFANRHNQIRYRVDVGYQFNITLAEGLDGYNEPGTANNAKDMYSQIGVVFKYGL